MSSVLYNVISLTQPCRTLQTTLNDIVLTEAYWSICPFLSEPIHSELLNHESRLLATLFVIDDPGQLINQKQGDIWLNLNQSYSPLKIKFGS